MEFGAVHLFGAVGCRPFFRRLTSPRIFSSGGLDRRIWHSCMLIEACINGVGASPLISVARRRCRKKKISRRTVTDSSAWEQLQLRQVPSRDDEVMVKKMTESDGDSVDLASQTSATMAATVVTLMDSQRNPCVVEIRLGQRSDDGFPSTMRRDSSALMKEEKWQVVAGWADCPWLRAHGDKLIFLSSALEMAGSPENAMGEQLSDTSLAGHGHPGRGCGHSDR
ncbi:hypothetical protein ACLOJK_040439, partial [Asimina triloba]